MNIWEKNILDISWSDLHWLIENQVIENKHLEYKATIFSDKGVLEKDKLLTQVNAFANSAGGLIIIGVKQKNASELELSGVELQDIDQTKLQLIQTIKSGMQPEIKDFGVEGLLVKESIFVILIKIERSWLKPHLLSKPNLAFTRNSAGKYPMDVDDLRFMFAYSDSINKRVNDFKDSRIQALIQKDTFVSLPQDKFILLLLLPLDAFVDRVSLSAKTMYAHDIKNKLTPMYFNNLGNPSLPNLEGLISYSYETGTNTNDKFVHSYVQLYRNGIIESAETMLLDLYGKKLNVDSVFQELELVLPNYLGIYKLLNISPPVYLSLTFCGIKDYQISSTKTGSFHLPAYRKVDMERNMLILPDAVIDNYELDSKKHFESIYELIWNAFGFPESL